MQLPMSPSPVDIMKSKDSSQLCHQEISASIKVAQPSSMADKLTSINDETIQLALPSITSPMTPMFTPTIILLSQPSVEIKELNQLTHQECPTSKQVATHSTNAGLADISEEQLKPMNVKLLDLLRD
eukprot:12918237-Ditylum_brightwellii.AAC.1